ncbi:MAG: hypothetical protein WBF88_02890 [Pusillimonas sp.]
MSNAELLDMPVTTANPETHGPDLAVDAAVKALAGRIRAEMASGNKEIMTLEALQDMLGALFALYAGHAEEQEALTPLRLDDCANATAILMTTSALLRGANLELFELGMWQSWSGMK